MDFLQEFNTIKNEYETIETAAEWYDGEEYDSHIKYIINAEYGHHEKPTIHYNLEYGGNAEFNKLLSKYKLLIEWENPAIVLIYDKNEVKNSVAVFLKGEQRERYIADSDDDGNNTIEKYL